MALPPVDLKTLNMTIENFRCDLSLNSLNIVILIICIFVILLLFIKLISDLISLFNLLKKQCEKKSKTDLYKLYKEDIIESQPPLTYSRL
jgi:hypothetical protein